MLRIATLNIAYHSDKHGAWERRREAIVRVLRESKPDVVALQAVERLHGETDQANELAQIIGNYGEVVFHPAQQLKNDAAQGLAFIARWDFAYTDHLALSLQTGLEDTNRRIVLHARSMPGDKPLNLFNAHLSWVAEQNADNVRETIAYARRFPGDAVLVGDFNAQADTLGVLRKNGWIDAWAELRPDEAGLTFEAGKAEIRIDYTWVTESLRQRLRSIEIIADLEANGIRPSDHYGLLVELGF
jgi:endonuclease/exonuclease/phosphatase family metal-dependent hydrolase